MTKADWDSFFQRLDALPKGERVALKREVGTMLYQADGRTVRIFYQCLPYGATAWQEDRIFAAACLHCLWDTEAKRQPIEQIFYQLRRDQDISESTGHRLETLLDVPWDEDGFMLTKLVRLIRLAKFKGYAVDCQQLLEDLFYWNGEKQSVQRKWARALYQKPEDSSNVQEGE
ncbi:MAG: type I-E CRISPR-associated protein Cse2/CasB [Butyricicoccus pullicaecorum]|nr:type I-E CRISPR-associated protein Cse2/CasB [Butyricicoccus pullicaecorum]